MELLSKKTKAPFLYEQDSSFIVDRSTGIVPTADRTVKPHDGGNNSVDFLCGFFFVCLYISCWISNAFIIFPYRCRKFSRYLLSSFSSTESITSFNHFAIFALSFGKYPSTLIQLDAPIVAK